MPEPVCSDRKLHRNERLVAPVIELAPVLEYVVNDRLTTRPGQEFVNDYPLVMPADKALRLGKALAGGIQVGNFRDNMVDDGVMEFFESQMELRDYQVLVVARIANQTCKLPIARNVELGRAIARLR
jgi:hypothetical protein